MGSRTVKHSSSSSELFAARALVKEARITAVSDGDDQPIRHRAKAVRVIVQGRNCGCSSGTGSGTGAASSSTGTFAEYTLPFDATWQPDLFGRIRNTVSAAANGAQASAADLANTRLTMQVDVAMDYFQLRGQDALKQLLDSTVVAYQQSADLTKSLFDLGIDSEESLAQAETQLEATQAQDTALGIQRAQFGACHCDVDQANRRRHYSIPVEPLNASPPAIPIGVPSCSFSVADGLTSLQRSASGCSGQCPDRHRTSRRIFRRSR